MPESSLRPLPFARSNDPAPRRSPPDRTRSFHKTSGGRRAKRYIYIHQKITIMYLQTKPYIKKSRRRFTLPGTHKKHPRPMFRKISNFVDTYNEIFPNILLDLSVDGCNLPSLKYVVYYPPFTFYTYIYMYIVSYYFVKFSCVLPKAL